MSTIEYGRFVDVRKK